MRFISNLLTLLRILWVGEIRSNQGHLRIEYQGVTLEIENGALWVDAAEQIFINCKEKDAPSNKARRHGGELLREDAKRALLRGKCQNLH